MKSEDIKKNRHIFASGVIYEVKICEKKNEKYYIEKKTARS